MRALALVFAWIFLVIGSYIAVPYVITCLMKGNLSKRMRLAVIIISTLILTAIRVVIIRDGTNYTSLRIVLKTISYSWWGYFLAYLGVDLANQHIKKKNANRDVDA